MVRQANIKNLWVIHFLSLEKQVPACQVSTLRINGGKFISFMHINSHIYLSKGFSSIHMFDLWNTHTQNLSIQHNIRWEPTKPHRNLPIISYFSVNYLPSLPTFKHKLLMLGQRENATGMEWVEPGSTPEHYFGVGYWCYHCFKNKPQKKSGMWLQKSNTCLARPWVSPSIIT